MLRLLLLALLLLAPLLLAPFLLAPLLLAPLLLAPLLLEQLLLAHSVYQPLDNNLLVQCKGVSQLSNLLDFSWVQMKQMSLSIG